MLKTAADILQVWHSQHWGRKSQGWPTPLLLVTFLSHWNIQTWNCLPSRLILLRDDSWPYDTSLIWLLLLKGESILIEQMEKELWLSKASPSNRLWIPSHWSQHLCFWNFRPHVSDSLPSSNKLKKDLVWPMPVHMTSPGSIFIGQENGISYWLDLCHMLKVHSF